MFGLVSIVDVSYQYLQIMKGFEEVIIWLCMFNGILILYEGFFCGYDLDIKEIILMFVKPFHYTSLFMGVLSFLGWHIWFFKRLNGVL
jgi:hypothetical protein